MKKERECEVLTNRVKSMVVDPMEYMELLQQQLFHDSMLFLHSEPNSSDIIASIRLEIPVPGLQSHNVDDYVCEYYSSNVLNKQYSLPNPDDFLNVVARSLVNFQAPYKREQFLIKTTDINCLYTKLTEDSPTGLVRTVERIQQLMSENFRGLILSFVHTQVVEDTIFEFKLQRNERTAMVYFRNSIEPFVINEISAVESPAIPSCSTDI
jgi:hypothetical protein